MKRMKKQELKPQNTYYEGISERFGMAQVLIYLCLLAFVSVSLLANTHMITYQNLYYFIKDLNAAAEQVDVMQSDAVSYPTDRSQSFTLYRQGLAVAGNTSVTLFTASGRQTVSRNVQYQNPTAIGSGKYLLVYEQGGTKYSLYNSYTQIHAGKTDAPIRCATLSTGGMYAFVTDSDQYASVMELFSSDFELINRYRYNSYVTDVAIDEKGDYLAALISDTENGEFSTSVRFYRPREESIFSEVDVSRSLGLRCQFTQSGELSILCGNGVYYASVGGKLITESSFEGSSPVAFDLNRDGCVVILKKSGNILENQIIVFDKSGKMMYNGEVDQTVHGVALGEGFVCVMLSGEILRIRAEDGQRQSISCETENRVMLVARDGSVLLCSPKKAVSYRFS